MKHVSPRDFIETKKGLFFAALNSDVAFLRYYPHPHGDRERGGLRYKRIGSTESSFEYLERNFPEHIFMKGARRLQHCPPETIRQVYSPVERLEELKDSEEDPIAAKCLRLSGILEDIPDERKGVTGSILVDLHRPSSDIDFVVYGSKNFHASRDILRLSEEVKPLTREQWRLYYEKRFPRHGSLSFEEFLWHEQRKHNIGMMDGTMYNLLLVDESVKISDSQAVKPITIRCTVTDASMAFHVPSVYKVRHDIADEVLSYTHTYAGQARDGEVIEVSGVLEKKDDGYRVVVGTTREAEGEYIKVV